MVGIGPGGGANTGRAGRPRPRPPRRRRREDERAGFETGRARRSVTVQRLRRGHRSRTEASDGGSGEPVRAGQSRERRTRRELPPGVHGPAEGRVGVERARQRAGESFETRVCRDGDGGSETDARSESRRPGRRRLHWPIVTASALTVSTAEDPNASILESTQVELREPTGARASQGWLGERPAGVLAR
jgi:hypothetical protein